MRPLRISVLTLMAAALVLCSLATSAGSIPTIMAFGPELWVAHYSGPADIGGRATSLAVSADGTRVFVTGSSEGLNEDDYATVAYDAATGKRLWDAIYDGPANGYDDASSLAVSPDGNTVFVTGVSDGGPTITDYATIAYKARTGKRIWLARYNGPENGGDLPSQLAVSADGREVFVTGSSGVRGNPPPDYDFATVAYDAATGRQLWVAHYDGPAHDLDYGEALALSRDGARVFVTGSSTGGPSGPDYATVAYEAADGKELWVARYRRPADLGGGARSLAVSNDGARVFVSGSSDTLAYDAANGAQLWVARVHWPGGPLAVSKDGTRVFVTGSNDYISPSSADYGTAAYNAATGAQLWVALYDGPANGYDGATALALSNDGTRLFVSGQSDGGILSNHYATVAYDARSGTSLWVAGYNKPGTGYDSFDPASIALSSDGRRLFVTGGESFASTSRYATIAYDARYHGPARACLVPKLRGLPLAEAKAKIRAGYCAVGTIKRTHSQVAKGRVVSQKQKAGTWLAANTKVGLVVSRGPKPGRP